MSNSKSQVPEIKIRASILWKALMVILNTLSRAKFYLFIHTLFFSKINFEMLPVNVCFVKYSYESIRHDYFYCTGYNNLKFLSTLNYECISLAKVIPCMILGTFPGSRTKDEPHVWTYRLRTSGLAASKQTCLFCLSF